MVSPRIAGFFRILFRLGAVWLVWGLAVELAEMGPALRGDQVGGQTIPLLRDLTVGSLPDGTLWREAFWRGTLASLGVTVLAILIILAFGPLLGVVAGRYRRGWPTDVLLAPVLAAGWMPAFWLILLSVWWQIGIWRQPGFADAPPAVGGPVGIEPLWHVAQIAVLVALGPIGWQIRSLSEALRRQARAPHVRAAQIRGLTGAPLFYRHVFRRSLGPLVHGVGRTLPAMLGAQVVVEWAFRYPGLGRLAIDRVRAGDLAGLLGAGLILGTATVLVRAAGDAIQGLIDPHPQ